MLGKAALYDAFGRRFERKVGARLRRAELAPSRGRVLEIGAGTGANLPHYPDGVDELVVTEPDAAMLKRLRRRAGERGRDASVVQASAQALPFNDASFDTVVATAVLCSVPSQAEVLREVRRVLRPGGQFLSPSTSAPTIRATPAARTAWTARGRSWRPAAIPTGTPSRRSRRRASRCRSWSARSSPWARSSSVRTSWAGPRSRAINTVTSRPKVPGDHGNRRSSVPGVNNWDRPRGRSRALIRTGTDCYARTNEPG